MFYLALGKMYLHSQRLGSESGIFSILSQRSKSVFFVFVFPSSPLKRGGGQTAVSSLDINKENPLFSILLETQTLRFVWVEHFM